MESSSNNNNVRRPIEVKQRLDVEPLVKVVLWDFDGPINNVKKFAEIQDLLSTLPDDPEKRAVAIQRLEQEYKGLKVGKDAQGNYSNAAVVNYTTYIDNVDLIKATLEILHQNNIASVIASQRTTYGVATRVAVDLLEAIQQGLESPIKLTKEEDIQNFKNMLDKALSMNGKEQLANLLLDFVIGKLSPEEAKLKLNNLNDDMVPVIKDINEKPLHPEQAVIYKDYYDFAIKSLRRLEQDENIKSRVMYEGLDGALGKNRPFLLQKDAQTVGEAVALFGIDTHADKFCYTQALTHLPAFNGVIFTKGAGDALLVDDMDYSKNFPGGFIWAPRPKNATPDEDLAYLAQVLLKSVPFPKLLQDLAQYEDKAASDTLLRLVFNEKLKTKTLEDLMIEIENTGKNNDGQKLLLNLLPVLLSANDPNRTNESLTKLIDDFTKHHKDPKLIQTFILHLLTAQANIGSVPRIFENLEVIASSREHVGNVIPMLIEKYAEELKKDDSQSEKDRKSNFKDFVISIIDWLNNPANLADSMTINKIINMLKDKDYDDLLRLETGGHGKASKLLSSFTKKEEKKYGMTTTWSEIIEAAKNQVKDNIDGNISRNSGHVPISLEQDRAFRELFSLPSDRFSSQVGKLLNHSILKPKQLEHYESLVAAKKIIPIQQPAIKFMSNQNH